MKYTIVKRPFKDYPFETKRPYHVEREGVWFSIFGAWEWKTQEEAEFALQNYFKSLTREVVATYEV